MTGWIYNKDKKGKINDCEDEAEETVASLTETGRRSGLEDKEKDVRFKHDELKVTIHNLKHFQLRIYCVALRTL